MVLLDFFPKPADCCYRGVNLLQFDFVEPFEEPNMNTKDGQIRRKMRTKLTRAMKKVQAPGIMLLPLFFTACIGIHFDNNVHNVDAYFVRARAEIAKLEARDPDRSRRAHRLCLLIHDASEDRVVRLSVPLWLVNLGLDFAEKAERRDHREGFDYQERYDLEWKAIKDLGQFGRGLLVSVEEENDRILVWMK